MNLSRIKLENLWYIIGYIAADGYLSKDGRHINITSKDRDHLYSIRKALFLKNKIGRKYRSNEKVKTYSQLQFGDVNFYRYLLGLGFLQQKSLNLGVIKVEKGYFADFLRGVIDGDGNISSWIHKTNQSRQWSLRIVSAAYLFISWLANKIEEHFKVKGKLYIRKSKHRKNPICVLKFGKTFAKIILSQIYYDGCLALKRKFAKAELCLQDHN